MATLTFLRIGKEIHDELEDFLADHLIQRQKKRLPRLRYHFRKKARGLLLSLLNLLDLNNIL